MSNKIYIIGLDGASAQFIFSHTQFLPNFRKLIKEGASGVLESTIPPVTCPAWNCLITGKKPRSLKLYDWETFDFTRGVTLSDWSIKNVLTLFEIISSFDLNVISINFPLTYPPRKVRNCVIVSGFPIPENKEDYV